MQCLNKGEGMVYLLTRVNITDDDISYQLVQAYTSLDDCMATKYDLECNNTTSHTLYTIDVVTEGE
jgi:hypothetical protein